MSKGPHTCGHSKTFILEREFRMIPCPLCRIAALEAANRHRDRQLANIVTWLQANQPDAFKRGLWDAIPPPSAPKIDSESDRGERRPSMSGELLDIPVFLRREYLAMDAKHKARIADLEASVLFWKKDAIAGTARIRELETATRCPRCSGPHVGTDCRAEKANSERSQSIKPGERP